MNFGTKVRSPPGAESCPRWRKIVIRACSRDDRASVEHTSPGPPNSQRDYIERPYSNPRGLVIAEGLVGRSFADGRKRLDQSLRLSILLKPPPTLNH